MPGRRRQPRALRRRLHDRQHRRHPEDRRSTRSRPGRCSSTWRPTTTALAMLSNGLRNVPTTTASLKSPELQAGPEVRDVPDDLRATRTRRRRRSRAVGSAPTRSCSSSFINKWQAGKGHDLQAGLATSTSRSTRSSRTPRASRCRERGAAAARRRAGPPTDRRARRRAAWRRRGVVLAFMARGSSASRVFFGYPLRRERRTSRSRTTTCSRRRAGSGSPTTRYMFDDDQQIWPAVRNTLWLVAIAVPLQVLFAFGVALMLTRARRGVGFFRDGLLPARARAAGRRDARVRLPAQPGDRPGEHAARQGRDRRAAVVRLARTGRSRR